MRIGTIQSLACVGLGTLLGFIAATRDLSPLVAGRRGQRLQLDTSSRG